MPKMKNATTRHTVHPAFERAFASACGIAGALGALATGGAVPLAAGYGVGWFLACIAIGATRFHDDATAPTGWRPADEADRPDAETWSWASPQGLPTAGPGKPVRRLDGHARFDNTGPA